MYSMLTIVNNTVLYIYSFWKSRYILEENFFNYVIWYDGAC